MKTYSEEYELLDGRTGKPLSWPLCRGRMIYGVLGMKRRRFVPRAPFAEMAIWLMTGKKKRRRTPPNTASEPKT